MITPNGSMPRHIIIKTAKVKERILKATREKVNDEKTPIRLSAYFSTEMLQPGWSGKIIVKVLKGKILQPRIFYPARLPFRIER